MVPSGSVCDYDDYFYDGHYDDKPDYFDYNNPGDFDSYPSVYGVICMARMTVGHIVDLGVMSAWCHSGVEMRKGTCTRVMLPCPGLVSDEPVDMLGIVLIVHSARVAQVAPVMRKVTFMRVMLPCPGPVPTNRSIVLLVHRSGPGDLGGPCDEESDVYEGDVTLPRTGSDEQINSVVSTSGPGGLGGPRGEEGDAL